MFSDHKKIVIRKLIFKKSQNLQYIHLHLHYIIFCIYIYVFCNLTVKQTANSILETKKSVRTIKYVIFDIFTSMHKIIPLL